MNILLTGGSSGLGLAILRRLAADKNNQIFFTYCRNAKNARCIEQEFGNAHAVKFDFSSDTESESLCRKIPDMQLDGLINNAFTSHFLEKHFHKNPVGLYDETFRRNLLPVIQITQAVINSFRKSKNGKIITILTSALIGCPPVGSSHYVAAKAYLGALAKCWAVENAAWHITSNTVSPAFMETAFTADIDSRLVDAMRENHPLKRLLQCNEVAEVVDFLLHASDQVNGIDFPINAAGELHS